MSTPEMPPPSGPPVVPAQGGVPQPVPPDERVSPRERVPPVGQGVPDDGWRRLSGRMLLVHPVRTLWSMAFPLLIAMFGFGRGEDRGWLWIAVAGGALALVAGVMTWYITRYRFTPDQLQLRTGLLSRRVLTAPLDRIRSVDIESSPVHRVLGLAKVKVGTGVDTKQIELDGLTHEQAAHLRVDLLSRSGATAAPAVAAADGEHAGTPPHAAHPGPGPSSQRPTPGTPVGADRELARIDWGWLRYAPFSLSSLVVVAGAVGVLSQFGDELPVDEVAVAQDAWAWVVAQALLVLAAGIALLVLLAWVLVSTASYVLTWWNLRLVREGTGNIRITHGLLTTRSQTIERAKVRGVRMGEPFLLRFVRGAELSAMATGVGMSGTVKVLPPAPRSVVQEVGHELLEEDGPLTMDLRGHGPKARRRTHVSRQWGTLLLTALVGVPTYLVDVWWFAAWPWWLPLLVLGVVGTLNALVAESAWRNLGHGLTAQHLVVQTGAVVRTREVLERAGIIGWVVHQGFFQRRLGLADLTATTAAGQEQVVAPNIPLPMAVELARAATPGMLDELAV